MKQEANKAYCALWRAGLALTSGLQIPIIAVVGCDYGSSTVVIQPKEQLKRQAGRVNDVSFRKIAKSVASRGSSGC
jgi:hypothetical protein